jgi:hypothetical protein
MAAKRKLEDRVEQVRMLLEDDLRCGERGANKNVEKALTLLKAMPCKKPDRPPRRLNAYNDFVREHMKRLVQDPQYSDLNNQERMKLCGELWKKQKVLVADRPEGDDSSNINGTKDNHDGDQVNE